MSTGNRTSPLQHLWQIAQVAAVVITIIGFAPNQWVMAVFNSIAVPEGFAFFSGIDFRHIAVGAGVALFAASLFIRRHWRAETSAPVAQHASNVVKDFTTGSGKPSIAVLPFVNMSEDKSQEHLADGMTEDIITGLSHDSRLFVIARNSTFAYKGQHPDIRTVGKELGVHYVLEGSIRPVGDRLRITVQLIETASGTHVWADKIDRPLAEIFEVMDELTDGIVTALSSNLGAAEAKRAERARPQDVQAWALCVQAEAMYYFAPSAKNLVAAEKLARRAAGIDPDYGASWGFIAFLVSQRSYYGISADAATDMGEVLILAAKARALAPQDSLVLANCGAAYRGIGHIAQSLDCLERSLELNPNNSLARQSYGVTLFYAGRPREGIAQLDMCLRLSPKDPYIGPAYYFYTLCHLALEEFSQAERAARMAIKLLPGSLGGYAGLAMALVALGRDAEAAQQIQKLHQIDPERTRQHFEDFWRLTIKSPEQLEKLIMLLRRAWPD